MMIKIIVKGNKVILIKYCKRINSIYCRIKNSELWLLYLFLLILID
jgi:hypothetical protein